MKKYLLRHISGPHGKPHAFERLTAFILFLAAVSAPNIRAQSPAGTGLIDGFWELTAEFPDYDLSAVVRFKTTPDAHSIEGIVLGPTSGRPSSFIGTISSNHLSLRVPGPLGIMDADLKLSGTNLSGSWAAGGLKGNIRGTRITSRRPEPDYYSKYLRVVCQIVRDNFYDPQLNGVDIEKLKAKYTEQLPEVKDDGDFVKLIRRLLGELKTSHTDFYLAPESLPIREKTPLITSRKLSSQTYYLRIRHFDPLSARDEQTYWKALEKTLEEAAGFSSLVVDLRGNRGGNLSIVLRSVSHFLRPGEDLIYALARSGAGKVAALSNPAKNETSGLPVIGASSTSVVDEIIRNGAAVIRLDAEQKKPYQGKMVILVDDGCYSACELFSAILQEKGRAIVIGSHTNGEVLGSFTDTIIKNLVVMKKDTGWRLEVPIIDFRTIGRRKLEGNGVKPDIEIAKRRETDSVLAEALRYLERAPAGQN